MLRYIQQLFVFLLLLLPLEVTAFTIKGNFKDIGKCYYPYAYLAVIEDIGSLNSVSSRFVIAEAAIDSNGNFSFSGDFLPKKKLFYRLYVTREKGENAYLSVGKSENFVLLVLDNTTSAVVNCSNICEDYPDFTVNGFVESAHLNAFYSFQDEYRKGTDRELSATKRKLLNEKYVKQLMQYADTSTYILPALLAVLNINMTTDYKANKDFFYNFLSRLQNQKNNGAYASQFEQMLALAAFKNNAHKTPKSNSRLWIIVLSSLLFISLVANIYLISRRKNSLPTEKETPDYYSILTVKEKQILFLVDDGLSNKEIADKLSVEVNTVKSHISRIYQKTNITSRNEMSKIASKLR